MPVYVKTNVLDKEDITSNGIFKENIIRAGLQAYYDVNNFYSYPMVVPRGIILLEIIVTYPYKMVWVHQHLTV